MVAVGGLAINRRTFPAFGWRRVACGKRVPVRPTPEPVGVATTGEELYSLAIALTEAIHRDDPPGTILVNGVDQEVLGSIIKEQCGRSFSESTGVTRWQPSPTIQRMLAVRALNPIDRVSEVCHGLVELLICTRSLIVVTGADGVDNLAKSG